MNKLVSLKLDGDLQQGVWVTLEIGDEIHRPSTHCSGYLPPNPDILTVIDQWQSNYRSLDNFTRIKAKKIVYDGSISQRRLDCQNLASELRSRLNQWLMSESFRPIRDKWLKHLMPDEEVRVLICTSCWQLEKLPWHLWELVDRDYPKAEVALGFLESEQVSAEQTSWNGNRVKILAILGDSTGIDVQQDRKLLENLPNARTTFLVEPQRQDINDQLWKRPWDILFFAGHSKTEGETGRIYINQTDSLTIAELRYALRNAVAQGLQLAIFNSCDGLGLARELQNLHIPQIIVMREPVPDLVAQAFLKYFLEAFSSKQSLYTGVRIAREKLQGLEGEYPSASWLPVICQNPGVAPMRWALPSKTANHLVNLLRNVLVLSVLITTSVLGVRHLGILQTWELRAFDQLMRSRPQQAQDPRLLIVTVTEDDFQLKEQQERTGSLSDLALTQLLDKLSLARPRTIGFDIYRDFPVKPNQTSLVTSLQTDKSLFAICKVSDRANNNPGISPPPEVPAERLGFSDVVKDPDGVVRRHLIAMKPSPSSPCTAPYALSAQLAFHYLESEGISAKYTPQGDLQLGKVIFKRLRPNYGGYQQFDPWGYQILLNYRSYRSPLEIAPTVTLKEILSGAVKPDRIKDRIVLIGVIAQSTHDYLPTPYSAEQGFYQEMPGVILQAQMVSQLVSAVKDGRSLLSAWPFWGEVLWVWSWSFVGGVLACRKERSLLYLVLVEGTAVGILYVLCLVLFNQSSWVPLVPSVLALVITGGTVVIYLTSKNQGKFKNTA